MKLTIFFFLFLALLNSQRALAANDGGFDCSSIPEIAKEMLHFFECGGQLNGGIGKCFQPGVFRRIQTTSLRPQVEVTKFQLQDSDRFQFVDVARWEKSSTEDFQKVEFKLNRASGKQYSFRFVMSMQGEGTRGMYGCAQLNSPVEQCLSKDGSRGELEDCREIYFLGKPGLR